jgi:hypothetical protein
VDPLRLRAQVRRSGLPRLADNSGVFGRTAAFVVVSAGGDVTAHSEALPGAIAEAMDTRAVG